MSRGYKKIKRGFYNRPTLEIAPEILGKYIVYNSPQGKLSARIVEVEAYIASDDPACHAFKGETQRNKPLFGKAGISYVYFIYGMYNCFNFVTEPKGSACAILLRGAEPCEGIDIMHRLSPNKKEHQLLNGPGKFCRSFGINRVHNNIDITGDEIYLEDRNEMSVEYTTAPRIGITEAVENPWRFYDKTSKSVSVK